MPNRCIKAGTKEGAQHEGVQKHRDGEPYTELGDYPLAAEDECAKHADHDRGGGRDHAPRGGLPGDHRMAIARVLRLALERAVDRGEVPRGRDLEFLIEVIPALFFSRVLTSGRPPDKAFAHRIVHEIIYPLATSPLPLDATAET